MFSVCKLCMYCAHKLLYSSQPSLMMFFHAHLCNSFEGQIITDIHQMVVIYFATDNLLAQCYRPTQTSEHVDYRFIYTTVVL